MVEEEPAADAKYAEGTNKATLLIPRPPEVIGRDSCNQPGSSR